MSKDDLKLLFAAIVDNGYSFRGDGYPTWGVFHIFGRGNPGPSIMITWKDSSEVDITLRKDGKIRDLNCHTILGLTLELRDYLY